MKRKTIKIDVRIPITQHNALEKILIGSNKTKSDIIREGLDLKLKKVSHKVL